MRSFEIRSLPLLAALALIAAGCSEATSVERDCIDRDGDGFGISGHDDCGVHKGFIDCDDESAAVHPGALDTPGNGIDEDCNGVDGSRVYDCVDRDGDGYGVEGHSDCPRSQLVDCNDADFRINPGAPEIPANGKNDDCKVSPGENANGDMPAPVADCKDDDRDGYGQRGHTDCGNNRGKVDCDDTNPGIHPGATEVPGNDVDEDCDGYKAGNPDDCVDQDHDGFGTQAKHQCGNETRVDCDDRDAGAHPGAEETCNGKDDDCDGQTDECPVPAEQVCHEERKVCVAELHGACRSTQDCNEGLRCEDGHCLGWTGTSCQDDGDCVSGHCNTNQQPALCVGTSCEALQCESGRCSEEIGCYECDHSDMGGGCEEGICAGYTCFLGEQYWTHWIYDSEYYPPMLQLAEKMVACYHSREGQIQPYLCGGIDTTELNVTIDEDPFNRWVCNESTELDFIGGAEDREAMVDMVGCGLFNIDELHFLGPLRAREYYVDCFWIDHGKSMYLGPCEEFPAR